MGGVQGWKAQVVRRARATAEQQYLSGQRPLTITLWPEELAGSRQLRNNVAPLERLCLCNGKLWERFPDTLRNLGSANLQMLVKIKIFASSTTLEKKLHNDPR